ncbi:MAG: D-alanine--D-alanine ligase family protein [Pleomorphochaeta sp.]|jgi:D-alanine-D-alanine ligase
MKILIFVDKLSSNPTKDERDTLEEAENVKIALIKLGHNVLTKTFSLNLEENLNIIKKINPDLIFNLVETLEGSDTLHLAPLLFEKYKIKYTGGNSNSLYLTGDKVYTKQLLNKLKIKTPKYYHTDMKSIDPSLINRTVIVKKRCEEASCGIDDNSVTKFETQKDISTFINNDKDMFVEEFIDGKEFSVSVLNINSKPTTLPIARMDFIDFSDNKPKILNYKSKWDEASFEYQHTKRSFDLTPESSTLVKKLEDISKKCFKKLGSKGYLRVDFRVDKNDIPYVLEINMNPCINIDSGFVAAANQRGINFDNLIKYIIKEERDE